MIGHHRVSLSGLDIPTGCWSSLSRTGALVSARAQLLFCCSTTTARHTDYIECTTCRSHAPVLFDLHQDCGETVPRFPCDWDGTWPAKDWVSGCMPKQVPALSSRILNTAAAEHAGILFVAGVCKCSCRVDSVVQQPRCYFSASSVAGESIEL